MMDCDRCNGPLIEIDRYRERLVGCIDAIVVGEEGARLFWTFQ
jgi:hypothetical protein